jgi:GntR family transcriptional regulator/MocR family aminotransferase
VSARKAGGSTLPREWNTGNSQSMIKNMSQLSGERSPRQATALPRPAADGSRLHGRGGGTRRDGGGAGGELFLDIGPLPGHATGLRARVEQGIREAIRSGRLTRGTRLPASRQLARDLGISRGTVLQAYEQLAAEGWIRGRQGSSTVVSALPERRGPASGERAPQPLRWRFDFRPGRPDPSSFPRSAWLRASRTAITRAPSDAFAPGDPEGQAMLRRELAGYVNRARGVNATPEQIVVTSGFTQGLGLVARALGRQTRRAAMEEPSMPLHRAVVRAAGLDLHLVGVDAAGMRVEELEGVSGLGLAVLTPDRQHPSGAALSPQRRARLLAWARGAGAVIVEDDYDGEFRYDRHPLTALQSLDPESVVYAGTLSKTLAPGLRLGWLVVPERLLKALRAEKALADWHSPALEQLTFAELLRSGAYDRHVRRMRLVYRRRRDRLLGALRAVRPDLDVLGAEAGLNVLLPMADAKAEAALLAVAGSAGIGLEGLATGGYCESPGRAGVIVGYGAARAESFERAVDALAAVLVEWAQGRPERAAGGRGWPEARQARP